MTMLKLNRYWETLELQSGDYILLNAQEDHFRLRSPHPIMKAYLDMIEHVSYFDPVEEIRRISLQHTDAEDVLWELQNELIRVGVITEASTPNSQDSTHDMRHRHLADWFDAAAPGTGWQRVSKLKSSSVGILGCGAAGSFVAMMLAATGVGRLSLIDGDHVELSNLGRQIFYSTHQAEIEARKTTSLASAVRALDPKIEIFEQDFLLLDPESIAEAISGLDCVVLTADQPRIHLHRMVNKHCVRANIPLIYGFMGQVGPFFIPEKSACFECLENHWRLSSGSDHDEIVNAFHKRPSRNYPSIVSGPALVAVTLFDEIVAFLSETSNPNSYNMLLHLESAQRNEPVPRDSNCPVCGNSNADVKT